jgi:hypothetical protein
MLFAIATPPNERIFCGLISASRRGICAKKAIGIPDGKAGDAIKAA